MQDARLHITYESDSVSTDSASSGQSVVASCFVGHETKMNIAVFAVGDGGLDWP